jgi:catechol 2,3-dioxygenase-like lactoylglutathione lyase family enzyme
MGELELLLRPGRPPEPAAAYAESGRGLVLYVDDLAAARRQLGSRGLRFDGCDGSESCPTFRDPDGHWFQVVEQAATG